MTKRASKTASTRYVKPRKGRCRIVDGKAVWSEEEIGADSATADTAPTLDELRGGRNLYNEQMSNDFNW